MSLFIVFISSFYCCFPYTTVLPHYLNLAVVAYPMYLIIEFNYHILKYIMLWLWNLLGLRFRNWMLFIAICQIVVALWKDHEMGQLQCLSEEIICRTWETVGVIVVGFRTEWSIMLVDYKSEGKGSKVIFDVIIADISYKLYQQGNQLYNLVVH